MNFFASSQYLQVVAELYFPGRSTRVGDVGIGGQILRLLIVDDREVVTVVPFLDYHEPLRAHEIGHVERKRAYAPWVVRDTVDWREQPVAYSDTSAESLQPAPFIDWSLVPSFDDYLRFVNAHHTGLLREERRRRRRLAERLGALEFCFDDGRQDAPDLALRWKGEQMRAVGRDDIFADPRNSRFFDMMRERGLLKASTLRASGRLLSVSLGVVHDGRWSGWIFAHDPSPELRKYSLGHQLLQSMLAHGFAAGHREFDFSIGGDPYKGLYATHARILGPLGRKPMGQAARDVARRVLAGAGLLEALRRIRKSMSSGAGS